MKKVSRRELARSTAKALLDGKDQKKLMRQLAAYLIDHNMVSQADLLLDDLALELEAATGHTTATVRTAHKLSPENQKNLEDYIKQSTGAKSVELTLEEDPSLLGGVVKDTSIRI
jgi:F0F1-type ATP synthase delta subunit